jgi:Uma2 family endonuclease
MMAGARNVHDAIVVNLLAELRRQLRGTGCRPFTGDGSVETLPGQIRRPDVGVDCRGGEPRLVVEVLSPNTRDFDAFEKLAEYKLVESLEHILLVEPNAAEVVSYARDADRSWTRSVVEGVEQAIDLPHVGVTLTMAEIYDGVAFPARPRLVRE